MRISHWSGRLTTALFLGLLTTTATVRGEDPIYTHPDEVPPSYALQGEYVGQAGKEAARFGAQVIALGNDMFRLVGYAGGLPGDGWDTSTERVEIEGKQSGDEVLFQSDIFSVRLTKDGRLIPTTTEDGVDRGELNRIERTSPTMGQKPPAGALVLFDGSSAEAFENGEIVQDDLLLANCETKEKFGDHSLHLEFRTPFKPTARGQARGNSGVYIQGRYEIQVLDSFGLSGEDNECGGIYKVAKPKVNMCYPPLQWQTYDIDFTAARYGADGKKTANAKITVRHNGVVIHDNLELPEHTPGKYQEADSPGPLYLQGHGNPVVYRNIWVVQK
ncbi:family 16 glycoside hydrolase [Candidatus Laterigemmans baculatus]|uniref:family 16 glycoside hydrolase n=1 Tax=Candidatus Laterigemmans baculatus TaxID=2770505 RepID=UPI0013DA70FD|nr:family 16 glycoside hydrolase [Candidatus Laterigemmans baculatus]